MARSFVWLTTGGGAWSLASNWDDVTDHTSPSLVAPGAQDNVSVTGLSGAQLMSMTGGGVAGWAAFAGNTQLLGAYVFGTLSLGAGGSGGLLQLGTGASVSAGTAALTSGSLLAGGGSTLSVAGTLSLGAAGVAGASLTATGGSDVDVLAMVLSNAADSIYVDPSSIVEVGGAGAGVAGALTIDAGASLSGQGSANMFGAVVNSGTLAASGGTLSVGALSGTGTLQIGRAATLALDGVCGAGQTVAFAGQNATLALDEEAFAPAGTLTGLATSDAVDIRGSAISSATYAASGAGTGVLSLFYGTQIAAQLTLAGTYAGRAFLTSGDGAGGTLITLAAQAGGNGGGGGGPPPGTTSPDQYAWTAPGPGNWSLAANWQDVTTGASPAAVAPGANNLVTIAASQTSFSVVTGPANAASLSLLGEVGLSGAYQIGTLTVGQAVGTNFTAGTLDVLPAGTVIAGTCTVADGAISVAGSGTALSVAGTLVLGGSAVLGPGLPTAALTVASGAHVQAAGLVMGGGSGATLTTDPTGWVEVGSAGGAAAGAVTVDAGCALSGNGQVNPFGAIIDQGDILAAGGTLTLGTVSGAGSLTVAAGATLELEAATPLAITLDGSAAAGLSTVAMAGARAAPTGTISGLVAGDVFDLEGSPLTSVQFVTSNAGGTLLLIYNTTIVARLNLAGDFTGERFLQNPDGAGGTQIVLVPAAGGGGGTGQSGTDQLAWAAPVSGSWSRAANWTDVTTGQVATQPPGTRTPVQIAGPGGTSFQSITGTGTVASLGFTGNTDLSGTFSTGVLTVGQLGAGMSPATPGTLAVAPGAVLDAAQGTLACGVLSTQSTGTEIDVAGTLTLGGDTQGLASTLLEAVAHSAIELGGLSMGAGLSNTVLVDDTSWIEVGTAGNAALGALTVDAGALASGAGTLNPGGAVIDNGLIEAEGGTLVLGVVTGSGTLGIGTEASLALSAAETCPVAFLGGGATLELPGSASLQAGLITGFAAGDSIVVGSPVDGVSYVQGGGGAGTLLLSVGGVAAGQLLLAGNFAGDLFTVTPDGAGASIVLQPEGVGGPPPGTVTPDAYQWTGGAGDQAWAQPGNWTDLSQGAGPAAVAPGQNDAVSIVGDAGAALDVGGPADAASLALSGTVSLAGLYAVGTLSVNPGGLLALSSGEAVTAAAGQISGSVAVGGGALAVGGTLALGSGGALVASGGGTAWANSVVLGGTGSLLATDRMSSIEIGGSLGAALGAICVDADGVLQGAGVVGAGGQVIDQGTIAAAGTLVLGAVSGGGTLLVGGGADLVLSASAAPGLTADFAGGGTLTLASAQATPAIEDLGTGSSVLLSWLPYAASGMSASYAATGPGTGLLTLSAGGQALAQFALLGDQAGRVFTASAAPGGGTILGSQPDPTTPQGGTQMTTYAFSTGQITRGDLLGDVAQAFPYVSQTDIGALIGVQGIYLDYDTDGLDPPQTVFGGAGEPPGVNVEIVAPLDGVVGGGIGPGGLVTLTAGYSALLLEGNENLSATDSGLGHAMLVGNYGTDLLFAGGDGDTLVGAPGANTTFAASLHHQNGTTSLPIDVYVHGGGNDLITTGNDNAAITTSGGHSTVFLGASNNAVTSAGADEIVCAPYGDDTVLATAQPGTGGDTVFAPTHGLLTFVGGNTPLTVVGGQGEMVVQGGSAGGNEVWAAGSDVNYTGGAGSAVIVAGSGFCSVQGGSGPVTVFGGSGQGVFSGGAGSAFVAGDGPSTINATAGGTVFLVGSANVSVAGGGGTDVYGANSTGDNTYQAMTGNVTLWGGPGSDQFIAGSGNDIMVSAGGDDTFNFSAGTVAGQDIIVGFTPGQDTIALHGFGTQMPQLATAYGDTVINLQGGAQIIIENVTNLTAASFKLT